MHFNEQLIHKPVHLFNNKDAAYSRNAENQNQLFAANHPSKTSSILVERDDFHVRIADTQGLQRQVSALINRMYSWRGYQRHTPKSRHTPNQTTLHACGNNGTLGTLSLNIDSDDGLLADDLYCKEIDQLRQQGGVIGELTGLAVSTRSNSNELLATLFHLLHIMGRRLHHVTDAVIEVNPRHSSYYQRLLGFRQIGARRTCARVNAPAVLLHIETNFVEEQIARYAGQTKKTGRSLYPHFFSKLETSHLNQRILEMSHLLLASPQTHS